jgi:hypothetical protein
MPTMSDEADYAKAIEEASKLGRDLIANADALEGIATRLLGPFAQGYGLLADLVRHKREELEWRHRNRMNIYAKVAATLSRSKISPKMITPIPARIAYGYEEGLEREDNDDIQNLWANLLLNVTKPGRISEPLKIFGDILSKLDHDQAFLLNEIGLRKHYVNSWYVVTESDRGGIVLSGNTNSEWNTIRNISTDRLEYDKVTDVYFCPWPDTKLEITVDALTSLALLRRTPEINEDVGAEEERIYPSEDFVALSRHLLNSAKGITKAFHITDLGKVFIDLVSPIKAAGRQRKTRARKHPARSDLRKP